MKIIKQMLSALKNWSESLYLVQSEDTVNEQTIGVLAIFCQGSGEPFAEKIVASCPNFYETDEEKRGSYDALT